MKGYRQCVNQLCSMHRFGAWADEDAICPICRMPTRSAATDIERMLDRMFARTDD